MNYFSSFQLFQLCLLCLPAFPAIAERRPPTKFRLGSKPRSVQARPAAENSFTPRSTLNGRGTSMDPAWLVNLAVTRTDKKITPRVVPEAITSGQPLVYRPDVDSWPRELTYVFRDLNNRVLAESSAEDEIAQQWLRAEKPMIAGNFRLAIRELGGKILFKEEQTLWFGPAGNGAVRISYRKKGEGALRTQILDIESLGSPQGYTGFLMACTQPFENGTYPLPKEDRFMVELSYRHQDVRDCNNRSPEHCKTELAKYPRTWIPGKRFTSGYPYAWEPPCVDCRTIS